MKILIAYCISKADVYGLLSSVLHSLYYANVLLPLLLYGSSSTELLRVLVHGRAAAHMRVH